MLTAQLGDLRIVKVIRVTVLDELTERYRVERFERSGWFGRGRVWRPVRVEVQGLGYTEPFEVRSRGQAELFVAHGARDYFPLGSS